MRRTVSLRYWLVWWTFIGFACRAVVPVGYMPASVGEGGPFVLCHGGVAGVLLQALGDHASDAGLHDDTAHTTHTTQHAHHGDHGEAGELGDGQGRFDDAWEICPIGVAAGAGPITADLPLPLLTLRFETPTPVAESFVLSAREPAYHSRAPPSAPVV